MADSAPAAPAAAAAAAPGGAGAAPDGAGAAADAAARAPLCPDATPAPGHLPASLLFSSLGDPAAGFPGYCASTPPDWTGRSAASWPGRHGEAYAPFREGRLRPEKFGDARGRGLVAGLAAAKGDAVCQAQPPLALYQYHDSRRVCEVCARCHTFVGSARSALARPLAEAAGAGRPEDLVDDPADLDELEAGEWSLGGHVSCRDGCGAVFCGEECAEKARAEGWHRVLCTDLPPEKRRLWGLFKSHAHKHHELFILAAQVIAEIVCLVRHHDVDLWEAMAFFTRFAKMSWLSMVRLPSRSHTQGLPAKGQLADLARSRRERRVEVAARAVELLVAMLWERKFAELLTVDFFANLVGQFALSNVWVQVEHPLSAAFARRAAASDAFRARFGRLAEAAAAAARALAPPDGDAEGGAAAPLEPWRLPGFEGSGLYVCVALSNHSCRPNFSMRYAADMSATMMAVRDIEEGQELHLAYVSPSLELGERLASLWRHWGFVCTCNKCQEQLMAQALERARLAGGGASAGALLTPAGLAAALALRAPPGVPPSPTAASPRAAIGFSPPARRPCDAGGGAGGRTGGGGEAAKLATAAQAGARDSPEAEGESDEESVADSEEDEEDEEDEEEEEEDSAEDDGGCGGEAASQGALGALAGFESCGEVDGRPYAARPSGLRGVPPSVLALEADLRRLLAPAGAGGGGTGGPAAPPRRAAGE